MDDWLPTSSIAKELGVTVQWIGELCRAGRLPSAKKIAGRWFVKAADIELIRDLKPGRPKAPEK